jgi:hypothetical protein
MTPLSVGDVRRRCQTSHKAVFDRARARADAMLGSPVPLDWNGVAALHTFALLYQVTEDEKYARKAVEMLDSLSGGWPRDRLLAASYLRAASVAYDWCWPTLERRQRRRYARAMSRVAAAVERQPRPPDFSSDLALTRLSLLWVGAALWGDGFLDRQARHWIEEGAALLCDHLLPAGNQMAYDSGGHAEGFHYAAFGVLRPVAEAVELWRVASGENLFLNGPLLRHNALWHVYCRRPFDGALVRAEDCPSGRKWREADEGSYMPLLAARYHDGLAQWISRQIPRGHPQLLWTDVLWEDPSVSATPPDGLPLARLFVGLGWAAMRSGWSRRQDTFALFQCGPFYAARQHLDNNSFVIHKHRPLAIDSGVHEATAHRANYASRSVAHNTIVVRDDAEAFSDDVWGGAGTGGSNDGGQLRLLAPLRSGHVRIGSIYDTGRIIAYEHRSPYTYVAGDATRSYSAAKLESFVRQFVYLRPNLFIIFDRVLATRADFEKRWLLHTLFEPEVAGGLVTVWDRGSTKFYLRSFLPERARMGVIGGPGREYWVDGKNYRPTRKRDAEAGEWRIEVSPREHEKYDVFLHAIYTCEHVHEPMPLCRLVEAPKQVGVQGSASDVAYTVWFNRVGPVGGRVRLTRGPHPLLDKSLPDMVIQEPADRLLERWMVERSKAPP